MIDDRLLTDPHELERCEGPGVRTASPVQSLGAMSTREAAATLGVSEQSVRRAIARGDLIAVKHGPAYRISHGDLGRYGRSRQRPGADEQRARLVALPSRTETVPALPVPRSAFVGRDAELAALIALLDDPSASLVTLTGPGGIGKTRLALAAATKMQDRCSDGAAFIPLEAVQRADRVVPAIAQALGLRERAGQSRREQLARFLRGKQLLLVLDNFEQILSAGPEVTELLTMATGTRFLVTSRAPLRVDGERVLPVPPLTLPGNGGAAGDVLSSGAGQLFLERARGHDPSFTLDAESAPFVAGICARLDGLPLAIELAAARITVLPPREMHARLERRLPLLTRGARNATARHATLRDAIAWSFHLLSPVDRALFLRLAVFVGGFTLEAAEAVGGRRSEVGGKADRLSSDLRPPTSDSGLDSLSDLVDQSLLVPDRGATGEPRFRMLETIREFGAEQLAAAGEDAHARAAHADYFLGLAQRLRPLVSTHATLAPVDQLAAEDANFHAALEWLDDRGPAADFVALVAALCEYWFASSHYREAKTWFTRALAKIDSGAAIDRARLQIGYAGILMVQGDFTQAEPCLEQGPSLVRATGDPLDRPWALILRGAWLNGTGRYAAAEDALGEAISLADELDDPGLRAAVAWRALDNRSVSARGQGDFARATAYSEEALRLAAGHGFDLAESISLMNLGVIAYEAGDHDLAVARWLEGIALLGERGDLRQVADALSGIACVATAWRAHRAALLLFGAADALRDRVGTAMLWPSDIAAVDRVLATLRQLLDAQEIESTLAEGRAMPLAAAVSVATTLARTPTEETTSPPSPDGLTRREAEVLRLLAEARTDREIAAALFLSPRTVNWHVRGILAKLGAASRRDAIARARASGVV